MLASAIPAKIPAVWASSGNGAPINTIPATSQIGIQAGFASWPDGWVPLNDAPITSGGIPPRVQDMQGVLQILSAWDQWQAAGGAVAYDATFQGVIGGYPLGAVVRSVTFPGLSWRSQVDNNTSDPDTGGANWLAQITSAHGALYFSTPGTFTFNVPVGVSNIEVEVWGGGGGSTGGMGASGAAGGYSTGFLAVTSGGTATIVVGAGGAGSPTIGSAVSGATSSVSGSVAAITASGGTGGNAGSGPGGTGAGGTLNIAGQGGTDLDGSTSLNAPGGSAPRGGQGGTLNIPPTAPGGGGGSNSASSSAFQDGAPGGVLLKW